MCESWLWVLICNKYYTLYLPQIPAYVGQLRHMPQGAESSRGTLQQELCCQGSNSEGGAQPRKPGKEPGGKKPIVTPSGRTGQFWALNSTPQHSGATHTPSGYPGHSRCPWSHSLVPGNWMSQGPDSPEYGLASFIYFSFKFFQWGGDNISLIYIYSKENVLDHKGFLRLCEPSSELLLPSAVQHQQPGSRIFSEAPHTGNTFCTHSPPLPAVIQVPPRVRSQWDHPWPVLFDQSFFGFPVR